jgi:hypothetical protein
MQYRKKPVVIEAEEFTGATVGAMFMQWPVQQDEKGIFLTIPTLEGDHRADDGDFIICGIKGEYYPCKPDIFKATYDKVAAEN